MTSSDIAQEMRILEQQRQQLMMQKQSLQFEQNQVANAVGEVKKSTDDVYRMISGVLIKANKPELLKELEEKQKSMSMHLESVEKQEKLVDSRLGELQKELHAALSGKKK